MLCPTEWLWSCRECHGMRRPLVGEALRHWRRAQWFHDQVVAYHPDDFVEFVEGGHFVATESTYHNYGQCNVGHCVPAIATSLILQHADTNVQDEVGYYCRGKWYESYVGLKIQQSMEPLLTDAEKATRRWHVHVLENFIWHLKLRLMYSEVNDTDLHSLMDCTWDEISLYVWRRCGWR